MNERRTDTAVVLFAADARREERAKGLPPRFLRTVRTHVVRTVQQTPDVDLLEPPLREGTLAAQIEAALSFAFAAGYSRVILLAADVPALTSQMIAAAASGLGGATSAVIGGSGDGGFYLAGFSSYPGFDWDGVALSTARACASLTEVLAGRGWSVSYLEAADDIDSRSDATRVVRALRLQRLKNTLLSLLRSDVLPAGSAPPAVHRSVRSHRLRGPPAFSIV